MFSSFSTHTLRPRAMLIGAMPWLLALAACSPSPAPMLHGYVEAELLHVSPLTAGQVAQMAVARGQRVAQGQVLFTMESTPEERQAEAAAARREKAASQWANLRAGRRPLERAAAAQQLGQAQAALEASTATLRRQQGLVSDGFVSPARLDELRAQQERDAARVRELQAQLMLAQEPGRPDELAAAEAETRAAGADMALARWRSGQAQRTAPQAGQVLDVVHRPGEVVGGGMPVVTLLPEGARKVVFFVPESRLNDAAVGQRIELACSGCPAGLEAHIRWVSPQAEYTPPVLYSNEARAKLVFRVEAEPAPGTTLPIGQPVDVRLAAQGAPA